MAARRQPRLNVPPYGSAIQQAVASGQLRRMKAVAKQAEAFLSRHGDISAALEALRVEIARLEKSRR
jgi:hypothetical protein